MSDKFKPGSRKQRVWEMFESQGADKAFEFGRTLDLALGTLKSWLGAWGGKVTGEPKQVKEPKPTKVGAFKKPIIIEWAPNDEAYLIVFGPQVSECQRTKFPVSEFVSNTQWRYKDA